MANAMTPSILILLGGLWGAAAFPLYSIAIAHSNDHAKPDEFVMVSSGLLLMYGIGAVVGPLIASAFMQLLGAAGLYFFTGIVHVLLCVYLGVRRLRRRQAPAEEQHGFAAALTAAHTSSQVYEQEVRSGDAQASR
jgi:MFS family permease